MKTFTILVSENARESVMSYGPLTLLLGITSPTTAWEHKYRDCEARRCNSETANSGCNATKSSSTCFVFARDCVQNAFAGDCVHNLLI